MTNYRKSLPVSHKSMIEPLDRRTMLAAPPSLAVAERASIDFSPDWRFIRSDVNNAQNTSFNDSGWELIDLPHTWNAVDGANGDGTPNNSPQKGDYDRGAAWYRKTLRFSKAWDIRRIFIEIGAASINGDLYVNGTFVGSHSNQASKWVEEITGLVSSKQTNVIAIRVDNTRDETIPGYQGDWTNFGGLTRGVSVYATQRVQINPRDTGSTGVKVTTSNVSSDSATVNTEVNVRNDFTIKRSFTVRNTLVDANGNIVKQASTNYILNGRKSKRIRNSMTIDDPKLWQGVSNPYLYTLYSQVVAAGQVYDTVTTNVGIRSVSMDSRGLKLNGSYYDLKGVNLHDDKAGKGTAMSKADMERDIKLIKEMGANAVRFSHMQVDQYWYDLADKNGLVVWTEIPIWRNNIDIDNDNSTFVANAVTQMQELIRQNYNHPSIVYWGVFNEVASNNSNVINLLTQINAAAKAEDATRFTIGTAEWNYPSAENYIPDALTFNKYYGWYNDYGLTADQRIAKYGQWLESQIAAEPNKPIGMGEYGAGANTTQHVDDPRDGAPPSDPNSTSFHPEEYQAYLHEKTWEAIENASKPVWAAFIWQFADSANDDRLEGSQPGINDKGLMDYSRSVGKDSFYYYKSQWSSQPVLYLTQKRNTNRTDETTTVKAYSNLGQNIELLINGVSKGLRNDSDGVLEWNVTLDAGVNSVVIRTTSGTSRTDSASWTLPARAQAAGLQLASLPPTPASDKDDEPSISQGLFGTGASIL
jgi:beta-galactosidase